MMLNQTRSYLLAAALAIMGIALARQEWLVFERESRLNAEGVITQGAVRSIRVNKYESIALVEYAVPGEGLRVREVPVSRPFAHEVQAGGRVPNVKVRYLPQDPKVADVLNASQSSVWGVPVVLGLLALSAWSFNRARRAAV